MRAWIIVLVVAVGFGAWGIMLHRWPSSSTVKTMEIRSTAFETEANIPFQFSCEGDGSNPPLEFLGVPAEAKSLALVVEDPDAPARTFVHWMVWNIPVTTREVMQHSSPSGAIEGLNTAGRVGYTPPCPPSGSHRYYFRLYALDTFLSLDSTSSREEMTAAMENHILATAELMGRYQKQGQN